MRRTRLFAVTSCVGFALTSAYAVAMQTAPVPAPAAAAPSAGPGLTLINDRCGFCHSTAQIFSARKTPAAWGATVQSMADRGAEISPEEQKTIVDYLAANYAAAPGAPGANAVPPPPGTK
jgi:hypothetical protein